MPKPRDLNVLTRASGVRKENPLFKLEDKYYPPASIRTPELRKEADTLSPHAAAVQKLNKNGSHRY